MEIASDQNMAGCYCTLSGGWLSIFFFFPGKLDFLSPFACQSQALRNLLDNYPDSDSRSLFSAPFFAYFAAGSPIGVERWQCLSLINMVGTRLCTSGAKKGQGKLCGMTSTI